MTYSKDTFCILPFISMSNNNNGDYRVCCDSVRFGPNIQTDDAIEVWNSEFYNRLRKDLINGVQNENCQACWRAEKNNGHSMRKSENRNYQEEDIIRIIEERPLPMLFDFKLGNLCNLKCIMCCQLDSSLHETEVKQWTSKNVKLPKLLEYIEIKFKDQNQQYRIDKENCDIILENFKDLILNLKALRFVGGEPLINPLTHILVDKIIDLGHAKNLDLDIITNLTDVKLNFIKHLEQFKSVQLTCSYDHVDPDKFHYIRFPADYKKFKNNFDVILKSNLNVSISTTFSIFNIFDLEMIMDEFEKIGIPISFNYVINPNYFSIKYLNKTQKEEVIEIVNRVLSKDYKIFDLNRNLVSYLKNIDKVLYADQSDFDEVVAERTRVLELYDSTRGTNHTKLFKQF
jgi:organic radical activating enzyme